MDVCCLQMCAGGRTYPGVLHGAHSNDEEIFLCMVQKE